MTMCNGPHDVFYGIGGRGFVSIKYDTNLVKSFKLTVDFHRLLVANYMSKVARIHLGVC